MTDTHEKIIDALNDILQSRKKMIQDIQNALSHYGVTKELKGTILGKTHMVFENIKSFITKGDSLAITKEVRRGESVLIDYYKKAAILPLEPKIKDMLLSHIDKIEEDVKKSD